MNVPVEVAAVQTAKAPAYRSDGAADRFMRRLLRVRELDRSSGLAAHRAFRISVLVSGVRCLITYLLIPVLVPIVGLAGWVAAPISLALCVLAFVNGIVSARRFWKSDHRDRWLYTAFITVVFVILTIALATDLARLGVMI
ncbi:hypothetical protein [Propionimicrobium sp. PCR01-08-3]|uniref:hypothetical protein n=1 Tax=Propionimicrobium sp. PCR01-08-3 TaxID=3052086 RepID=UPI00255CE918|nr:hypothetical protein [Propionimicrobium sp. PCR01-08-3]WIY83718.1 hypothetical protein QQ658_05030 [Propionimicrobium sp. PCR01-08-3]